MFIIVTAKIKNTVMDLLFEQDKKLDIEHELKIYIENDYKISDFFRF